MNQEIVSQVQQKIKELHNIMSHKVGKGGENENLKIASVENNKKVTSSDIENNTQIQGGDVNMKPISRDGNPVENQRQGMPPAVAAGGEIPNTDFMNMVRASDPHNQTVPPVVTVAGKEDAQSTNTEINNALKNQQSTKEHGVALKTVQKPVSTKSASDEISAVVERVRALKKANEEISQIVTETPEAPPAVTQKPAVDKESIIAKIRARIREKKAKVEGLPTDPVKSSDASKTPQESVKSIKKKGEKEDRPLQPKPGDSRRYSPDKDIRDQWAADALKQNKKDESKADKEPNKDRPITNKTAVQRKAGLAGRIASLHVIAEDVAERLRSKKVKYPVETSPDLDYNQSAKSTEKVINKEHANRKNDKNDISPMMSKLWADRRRGITAKTGVDAQILKKQIAEYQKALGEIKGESETDLRKLEVIEANISALEKQMEKLSYVNLSTKPTSEMSWEDIIQEGNSVYADLQRLLGEIDNTVSPFLDEVDKVKKASANGIIRTAAEMDFGKEEENGEDKKDDKEDKSEDKKDDKEDKGDEKDDKKDDKKVKEIGKETVDLLKSIRDTAKEISEDVDDHLGDVKKETGIDVPEMPEMPGDMGLEAPPMGLEELPSAGEGLPVGTEAPMDMPRLSALDMFPKTAADEEEVSRRIMEDATISAEEKANLMKNIKKQSNWKAVFSKVAAGCTDKKKEEEKDEKKDKKEASAEVDKKNSYWSVYRGEELVTRATVEDLYKDKAEEAYDWASSKEYGQKLLASVLSDGIVTTAQRLGIESMIKTSAKAGQDKAYYKKIYPASYVNELFKSMKKKSEAELGSMKTKLADMEKEVATLKEENATLQDNQVLHAKAEKAIQLVTTAVGKGLVEQKDFDNVVDGIMLMDDNAYNTFASTVLKAPTFKKESMDSKIDMVKRASKEGATSLDTPIQIVNDVAQSPVLGDMRAKLEGMWKKPPVAQA